MKKKIQVIDADYRIEEGEVTVRCFGVSREGENILFLDKDFLPYLYAVPKEHEDIDGIEERIIESEFEEEGEEIPVRGISQEKLKQGNEEVKVLKVHTSIPPKIPKLKNQLWDMKGIKECREFDIPFYKRYLIDKGIKPAEWIEVEGEKVNSEEFDLRLELQSISADVEADESQNWETLAFDLEVYQDRIIMASVYSKEFQKVFTTEEIDRDFVRTVETERETIVKLIETVRERDVDILLGYNTDEYDFDVLRERSDDYGLELALGRDGERMKFNRRGRFAGARLKGRMHLDLYPFISHVLSPGLESETLDLDSVAEEMLGEKKNDLSWEEMKASWRDKEDLGAFADYALKDSELTYRLGKEIGPQILELSRITGLIPFDACRLTYGQLTENYLLREAHERDMLPRNRPSRDKRRNRRRQGAYSGGFVYTPEPGLYENIAVLDFKSLYPTVLVSHNISPDTLNLEECGDQFELDEFDYNFCQDNQGFFPELVEELVEDRSRLKEKMKDLDKDSSEHQNLDNRQQAEKILANSFYGYLGYNGARWYSRECAEATTYLGRQYIQDTIDVAEDKGFEIVYGDSLDYSRQIVVKDSDANTRFVEIGKFVEDFEDPESYKTLAWDKEKGESVFRPVKRAIMHDYDGDLLRFDTNRGRTEVTPQHSIYKYGVESVQLADAQELEKGDHLISISEPPEAEEKYSEGDTLDLTELDYTSSELRAYRDTERFPAEKGICPYCEEEYHLSSHVHSQHSERYVELDQATSDHSYIGCENAKAGRVPRFWELSLELAWILGFYCGDGSASKRDKQMISFGGQDKSNIRRVKRFFDEILDEELSLIEDIDSRTGNKMYYYRIQRKPVVSLFVEGLDAGKGSSGKKVPEVIINGHEQLKESFVEGYFEADGSRDKDHDSRYNSENMQFSTKSTDLANQVHYILKQLELGENGYGRPINDVSFKYRSDKPQIKSIRNTAPKAPEYAKKDFTPAKINNIEKVSPTKKKVYDLEVKGEHNFVDAEGLILVHNTDSVFLKGENIRENMDSFLEKVNSDLPEFMQLEFEGFFKRGFFTSTDSGDGAKKKYALIGEDGEMKITGFEQVRRDWSPIAKKAQKRVLRQVLENDVDEAVEIAKQIVERLREGEVPVEELRIYTTLNKKPENYDSTAPHVEAAKKAIKDGIDISPGSTIAYVITRGGGSISQRARVLEQAESYDADYYIENQVLPVVMRVLKVFGYTEGQLRGKGKQSGLGRF